MKEISNIQEADSIFFEKSSTNLVIRVVAILLVVANVIVGGMNFVKINDNRQFSDSHSQKDTTFISDNNITTTTPDKESMTAEINKETGYQDTTNIIKGEHTYTGIIKVDGLSCFLELEENILYLDANDKNPIESNYLWLSENDVKIFRGYNGLTVTLKGNLFNYRGVGRLMFNGTPTIISVVGTPNIITSSSSYMNWDSTDNETKFWDAVEVLEMIIYECEGVWNVRTLCDEKVLKRIEKDGFSSFDVVTLSINDSWISEYGYEIYITPSKDYVCFAVGSIGSNDVVLFTYSWDGNLINGDISLQEYIINNGLI